MSNLEELKRCRVVRRENSVYLIIDNGEKWASIERGITYMVDEYHYDTLECAYKTFNDFLNGRPYFRNEKTLLSIKAKEWLKDVVKSLNNVDRNTLTLIAYEYYCQIDFKTNDGNEDYITLPEYKNIIYDFSKLEKKKEYTFKELGIQL